MVKNRLAMRQTWVRSLGWENPLEVGMATHSGILAWRIPMDRRAWWARVHGVAKTWTRLSDSTQDIEISQQERDTDRQDEFQVQSPSTGQTSSSPHHTSFQPAGPSLRLLTGPQLASSLSYFGYNPQPRPLPIFKEPLQASPPL